MDGTYWKKRAWVIWKELQIGTWLRISQGEDQKMNWLVDVKDKDKLENIVKNKEEIIKKTKTHKT